jgi:quercetin dioxygenase-like cupin family protein
MTFSLGHSWIALSVVAGIMSFFLAGVSAATAGQCPAANVVKDGGQKAGAMAHKAVTEKLLGEIDLANESVSVAGHHLRMRRLEVAPGGEVAWHSHADRPALIYVVSGKITEYATTCSVPVEHDAGDLSVESHLSHWWKNNSSAPTVLLSADIAADPKDHNM